MISVLSHISLLKKTCYQINIQLCTKYIQPRESFFETPSSLLLIVTTLLSLLFFSDIILSWSEHVQEEIVNMINNNKTSYCVFGGDIGGIDILYLLRREEWKEREREYQLVLLVVLGEI